tara:strand:+ start:50235 stop:50537 length:303 start_codon:yes stop_codon:yes gene_type:complete
MPTRQTGSPRRGTTKKTKTKTTTNTDVSFDESRGSISYSVTITKSIGRFETLKMQAGVTVPYGASDDYLDKLDELMEVARDKVTSRLTSDMDDLSNDLTS